MRLFQGEETTEVLARLMALALHSFLVKGYLAIGRGQSWLPNPDPSTSARASEVESPRA